MEDEVKSIPEELLKRNIVEDFVANGGGDAKSSPVRDGPAIDIHDNFDSSSIPMITTSPSKHGENLNAYMEVCHNWIDAELQSTKLPKLISSNDETVKIIPVQSSGYDNNGYDGSPTDEDCGSPVSLNGSMSDGSEGPPPPPPPLLPSVEGDLPEPSKSNTETFPGGNEFYNQIMHGSATTNDETIPSIVSEGVEPSPFDEITVATHELDTTIDTTTLVDNTEACQETVIASIEDTKDNILIINQNDGEKGFIEENEEDVTMNGNETLIDCINDASADDKLRSKDVQAIDGASVAIVNKDIVNNETNRQIQDVSQEIFDKSPNDFHEITSTEPQEPTPFDEITEIPHELDVNIEAHNAIDNEIPGSSSVIATTKEEPNEVRFESDAKDKISREVGQNNTSPPSVDPLETVSNVAETATETLVLRDSSEEIISKDRSGVLVVETFDETIFVGDFESPHDKVEPPSNDPPFLGNVVSPSVDMDHYPLDEEILNMSPVELEALVQQVTSAVVETPAKVEVERAQVTDSKLPPDELESEMSAALPEEGRTTTEAEEDFESIVASPQEVLQAVVEFTPLAPSTVTNVFDTEDNVTCASNEGTACSTDVNEIDTASTMIIQDSVPLQVPKSDVVKTSTQLGVKNSTSVESEDLIPDSRYAVIHQELQIIDDMVDNTQKQVLTDTNEISEENIPLVNSKLNTLTERDIMFEHLWKEPSSGTDLPTAMNGNKDMNVDIIDANVPPVSGGKNNTVENNMDFLCTRKGTAYVDYAKRSANKFQKVRDDILSGIELEEAAKLSVAKETFEHDDQIQDVAIVENLVSPASSTVSDNEIVRVPTTEDHTVKKTKTIEPVTTSCLDTCSIM